MTLRLRIAELLLCYNTGDMTQQVITRFPPSPTGLMHIGNIRSLLFNYLYARKHNGEIVMRFEDTDRERSKQEYADLMLKDLEILGLTYDQGPFYQSQKTDRYTAVIKQLIDEGFAYEAEESNDGSGKVIRFKNPNTEVTVIDCVRGEITIDTTDFGDFVIARSVDNPLYHLTVVVDDIDGGITHVIRGEDHITSTPRQILLIQALGAQVPVYAHLPLIVGDDKKKLGKRHGAVNLSQFLEMGYLPEAVVNQLALLGWNPGDEREIFSLEELVQEFSLARIQKGAATFSYQKLDDINKQHMLRLSEANYKEHAIEFLSDDTRNRFNADKRLFDKVTSSILVERLNKFSDVTQMDRDREFEYLFEKPGIDENLMSFKDEGFDTARKNLAMAADKLEQVSEDQWTIENIKEVLWDWSGEIGRGSVLHPMRTVMTGMQRSPDPFTVAYVLGKKETLVRLRISNENE